MLEIPVLGRVAAGAPIGPDLDIHTTLHLDRSTFTRVPDYLLRVQGDSMIEDGILDGDLVGVHRNPQASDGQIVVARLDGEVTIKRLQRRADRCACCRATRPTNRSSSRPIRTSPSKVCSAGWCAANDGRGGQPDALLDERRVWKGRQQSAPQISQQPSGHALLDAALPSGGWPAAALTEVLIAANGSGELRLLWPSTARLSALGERIVLVAPPYIPYPQAGWPPASICASWW